MPKVNKPKSTDIQLKLGKKLQKLRAEKKVNQAQVAQYIGLTIAAYQNYENGRREANYETLTKLAEFFDTSADYLLGLSPEPAREKNSSAAEPDAAPSEQEAIISAVLEAFRQLPPEAQKSFTDHIRSVVMAQNTDTGSSEKSSEGIKTTKWSSVENADKNAIAARSSGCRKKTKSAPSKEIIEASEDIDDA